MVMYYIIAALFATCIVYWLLPERKSYGQDGRELVEKQGKGGLVFFFLLVVFLCMFYFIGNAFSSSDDTVITDTREPGNKYKLDMVKNIREDVIVGFPPFGYMTHGGDGENPDDYA